MSIRKDKEKIIRAIMDLRTLVGEIDTHRTETKDLSIIQQKNNSDKKAEVQSKINAIHDMIFNI